MPGIKIGQSGNQAGGHRGRSVYRCCWETWTQSTCQAGATDPGRDTKVCREVPNDSDGSTVQISSFKEREKVKRLVKETERIERRRKGWDARKGESGRQSDDSGRAGGMRSAT